MRILLALLAAVASLLWSATASASDMAWDALKSGGAVALMRHARAPGVGDPDGFRLGDCATQRNLSAEGRDQSRTIGSAFRERGIAVSRILSSRWCRALDTARLAFGDETEPFPPLDSFFADREQRDGQTRAVREIVQDWSRENGVLVLVTHQVNITALTGVFSAEGEIVVLRPRPGAGFDIVGRVTP
jgi:phosphohistidine phosphatase SixA